MGCMIRVAVRWVGRITLFLDQPGAGKWVPDGKSGLCDPTAGSEAVHPATNSKLKAGGKKGEIFLVCLLSPLPQQGGLRVGWAMGAEENKNPHSARGSERFASK